MRDTSSTEPRSAGGADPWAAFGSVVAGVGVYGLLGWGLSIWLHAKFLIPLGILVGAALGLLLVYYQVVRSPNSGSPTKDNISAPDAGRTGEPTDDRGETE